MIYREQQQKSKLKAFTLLELIIVVIIVGVLAALALPRLFQTIEFSRSTEAWATIATVRRAAEDCALKSGGAYNPCLTWTGLNLPNQSDNPGSHFHYCMSCIGGEMYRIVACRNPVDNGDANSVMLLEIWRAGPLGFTPKINKCGQGAFSSLGDCGFDLTAACGCP